MTPDPTATSGMATADNVPLLMLPALDRMSRQQLDGHVCVWGGEALTPETAVNLGQRHYDGRMVSPRACRQCVGKQALRALTDHNLGPDACATCATSICDTGLALNRLIRVGHR